MLLLLILTVFVIYKLYKILGQENDLQFFSNKSKNVKDIEKVVIVDMDKQNVDIFANFQYLTFKQQEIISKIVQQNPLFNLEKFLQIVEKIHEMLVDSVSKKNTDNIKNQLTSDFLQKLEKLISESSEDISVNIIKINEIKIQDVTELANEYKISVYIDSKQNIKNNTEIEKIDIKELLIFICNKKSNLVKWELSDLLDLNDTESSN